MFLAGVQGTTIPAISVTQVSGEALQFAVTASQEPVTVRLESTTVLVRDPAAAAEPAVAWFSSRGPSDFDLLAPNVAAPGVNILAAYRELGGDPEQYEIIRGTSMASPHVAGSGALLRALHPDWSPAEIRAALTGTANPAGMRKEDGTPADPLAVGAGLIDLAAAGRVGLVLDESYADMLAANPATGGSPRTLNVPYLVNRQCNLTCEWTREVTSVADTTADYTATVAVPAGMTATVEPASFTLAPGASQQLTITVDVSAQLRWRLGLRRPADRHGRQPRRWRPDRRCALPGGGDPGGPGDQRQPDGDRGGPEARPRRHPCRDDPQQRQRPARMGTDRLRRLRRARPTCRGSP